MTATFAFPSHRRRLSSALLLMPLALALVACSPPRTDDASVAPSSALAEAAPVADQGNGEVIVIARFEEADVKKLHVGQRALVRLTEMTQATDRQGRIYPSERPTESFEGRLKAFGDLPSPDTAPASAQANSFVKVKRREPVQIAVAASAQTRAMFHPMRGAIVEMQRD
ncbi:hypothetical protein [Herbaspirillum robiniae]|uniref:HlyD family secretion protein n=1 Tax=Herbaspirillum robiniae TaxID=2014887 RepID=A0A246WWG8_9BURK|nr:hypothetical protein [Herbaspirillum robiniae]OWY31318.1 hypothetical protein CEJ42_04555 [Herbaspirillum robiniae]